jgi:hypothetical protein
MKYWIYDIETYRNAFTISLIREDGAHPITLEISERCNEFKRVINALDWMKANNQKMVGFNNLGFDYPVLHKMYINRKKLAKLQGGEIARIVFDYAQEQIDTAINGFAKTVPASEVIVEQVDLYRIWHFDNKAKSTSLKLLEFNMRADNIENLPFDPFTELTGEQIDIVKTYNMHDTKMTLEFFKHSKVAIDFREQLTEKYNRNFMNHNDTKIGKDYFIMKLEELMPGSCYTVMPDGRRKVNQTKRLYIDIKDCLFDYYDFEHPAFIAVKDWFSRQRIKQTKGVFTDIEEHRLGSVSEYAVKEVKSEKFKGKPTENDIAAFKYEHPLGWIEERELKATEYAYDENGNYIFEYPLNPDGSPDLTKKPKKKRVQKKAYWGCYRVAPNLNVVIDGFRFDFGTGGIHGSIESKVVKETKSYVIIDADVSSMYPNIAIANRVYPEHLSEKFCDIYEDVYKQRKSYPKGSAENMMLKLALNGVYGDSNNEHSPFYDPKYTMTITINGQLSLCLLAEKLLRIEGLKLVQVNTDGVTVACPRNKQEDYYRVCKEWQAKTGLQLEFNEYSKMFIRDVNNYIAVYKNGELKRKGAYQYENLGWHQDQSALIIPKAAEAAMLHSVDIRQFVTEHLKNPDNKWDFLLRTKVPKNSRLVIQMQDGTEIQQQNVCRYYISNEGGKLIKIMPPLEGETQERRLSIEAAWLVKTCNDIKDYDGDVNIDYYVQEAEKLVIGQ